LKFPSRKEGGIVREPPVRNQHIWKIVTDEGEKREVRASKFGGVWRIQSKLKSATEWTQHDPPPLADLIELRDVLFRKYEDVILIEKMIEERNGE
jgi:hypothetical protein